MKFEEGFEWVFLKMIMDKVAISTIILLISGTLIRAQV